MKACTVANPQNAPRCGVCEYKLVKNGKTSAGRTRWRCKNCGSSQVQTRSDVTRKAEFDLFLGWLLSRTSQSEIGSSARTFRRRIAWCWRVTPVAAITGEIHRQIMLDGTYFNGWCVLVAYTGTHVVDWQWCDKESIPAWTALLERIAAPDIVIVDGNRALLSVLTDLWPTTRVQRCYFHLRQGAHRHLTRNPQLQASKELLNLFTALSKVHNLDQAATWMGSYATWEATWSTFLKQRSYPHNNTPRPLHVRPHYTWWYTHTRLRKARGLIARVVRSGHLFTWLEHARDNESIHRTTSPLEGGINAGIKDLLRTHRGLREDHARRAVDWYLYVRTLNPVPPAALVQPHHWEPPSTGKTRPRHEQIGPPLYDTAYTPDEGIGIRKEWAGRS